MLQGGFHGSFSDGHLSTPDFRKVLFLFLMNDFLIVMVTENGDSIMLKFKFDFRTRFKIASLVSFASIVVEVNLSDVHVWSGLFNLINGSAIINPFP